MIQRLRPLLGLPLLLLMMACNLNVPQDSGVITANNGNGGTVRQATLIPGASRTLAHGEISDNWAGYIVRPLPRSAQDGSVSDIKAQWIIPAVSCSPSETYSAVWIGIDGQGDRTVEQIGTSQDCANGQPNYYAWMELYPRPARDAVGLAIQPGDMVSAEVQFTADGQFQLSLTNLSNGGNFSVTRAVPGARRRTAEWIAEAPYFHGILALANFGTVQFSNASVTMRGHAGPITDRAWQSIGTVMASAAGVVKAQPYVPINNGSIFDVVWKSS
jgi:Peptidase A4 family